MTKLILNIFLTSFISLSSFISILKAETTSPFFKMESSYLDIENILLDKFYLEKIHKIIHNKKHEIKYQYTIKRKISEDLYYNNSDFKCIFQKASLSPDYTHMQVNLNKLMAYVLGKNKNLDQKYVFNLMSDQKKKFHFFDKRIYQYISLPLKKFIKNIYISFYEGKLFESIYYISLSKEKFNFLKKSLNEKLNIIEEDGSSLIYLSKDKKTKVIVKKEKDIYSIKYRSVDLFQKYKKYIEKTALTLNKLLLNQKFLQIKSF